MPTADQPTVPGVPLAPDLLDAVAGLFGVLAATVRVQILWQLAAGERDVGTLADELSQSVPAVSHHLAKLKMAGIVRARRDGKRQVYQVVDRTVVDLILHVVDPHRGRAPGHQRSSA